jgi:hypothetical protein
VATQVKAASRLLRTTLKGADVDRMIEEDPLILFTEVSSGERAPLGTRLAAFHAPSWPQHPPASRRHERHAAHLHNRLHLRSVQLCPGFQVGVCSPAHARDPWHPLRCGLCSKRPHSDDVTTCLPGAGCTQLQLELSARDHFLICLHSSCPHGHGRKHVVRMMRHAARFHTLPSKERACAQACARGVLPCRCSHAPTCPSVCSHRPTSDVWVCGAGIRNLRELWDVDEQALRNSAPVDLALAVRALSDSGPPKRF